MTDIIVAIVCTIIATIVALYLIGAQINRRAGKQPRSVDKRTRDIEHYDDMDHYFKTAQDIANGVKQRRESPGPAPGTLHDINGEGVVPLNGVLVTRAIDADGKDVFHVQWSNHVAPGHELDTGDQLALAGVLTQTAMCQSVVFKRED